MFVHNIHTDVYKIRRKSDGLYSQGGHRPSFSKQGKTWSERRHLTNHLRQVVPESVYRDCEVVMCEVTEIEVSAVPVDYYIAERERERKEREEFANNRLAWEARNERYQEYLKLKKEFDRTGL